MANDCVFCKIIRGELPALRVYENEKTLAFLDIHPINPGHTLVIPKAQGTRNIFDVDAADWVATTDAARKVAHAIDRALSPDGVNIMMNNRSMAGQVVDHPHIHVIPRFKGDALPPWPHHAYKDGEAEPIAQQIRAAIS